VKKLVLLAAMAALSALPGGAQPQKRDTDLKAADGTVLKATYYPAAKPGPGVILLHMCNSQRKAWDNLATLLAARGIHTLTLDYRGYGESGGKPYTAWTPQERQQALNQWPDDIYLAYKYLASQPGVDREMIGGGGGSCGVENTLQLARRVGLKTVVLLAGGGTQGTWDYLAEASWMPVFASAAHDDGGAVDIMKWLVGFSSNPKTVLKEYPDGGHGTNMFPVHKDLEPAIAAWFEQYLVKTPIRDTSAVGPPGPSGQLMVQLGQAGGGAKVVEQLRQATAAGRTMLLPPEAAINALGYQHLQAGRMPDAIALFELNVQGYPNSANAYDSLGDAYLAAKDNAKALEFARKALDALDRDQQTPPDFKLRIRQSAEDKIKQLSAPAARPPAL